MPSDPAVELDIRGIPYIWCPGGCHNGVFGVYLDMLLWWSVEVYGDAHGGCEHVL